MKGRCYHKNPCDYFIQYTGNNVDEVKEFFEDINDSPIEYKIEEVKFDEGKELRIIINDGGITEEICVLKDEFIVIDEEGDIDPCTERVFYKYFQIANEEGGQQ